MLSLHQALSSLLLLSTLTAIRGEELTPVHNEEFSAEGSSVTLSYNSSKVNPGDYFFWYRQNPGQAPEFLLSQQASGQEAAPTSGLRIKVEQNQIHMIISSAAVTDSAVYYCAVNTGGYKMIFGSGTRLTIEPRDDYEPSYYELRDQNRTIRACLATGFSRSNATRQNELFRNHTAANTSRAVRATDGSLHSEVLLLSEDSRGKCEPDENDSGVCVDTLDKDVTVNTVSLLVVALRLLFLKTVVFNVLMTLRLWLRH